MAKTNIKLKCRVWRLSYDFEERTGYIWFPDANCCDMQPCIDLFFGIDRGVKAIQTFQGGWPDTRYQRTPEMTWKALAYGKAKGE